MKLEDVKIGRMYRFVANKKIWEYENVVVTEVLNNDDYEDCCVKGISEDGEEAGLFYPQELEPLNRDLLSSDSGERKKIPLASGLFDYFPSALTEIAQVSWEGNNQHNPGEPLHWAREKSADHADTLLRHFVERGKKDVDGRRHAAKMAWRALAILQLECEADGAPIAPGATYGEEKNEG